MALRRGMVKIPSYSVVEFLREKNVSQVEQMDYVRVLKRGLLGALNARCATQEISVSQQNDVKEGN